MLLSFKMYRHFGESQLLNLQRSPRAACERLREHVPTGETLWLVGMPSTAVAFYLDAPPLESLVTDPGRLTGLDRLFGCLEAGERERFAPPAGFRAREVDRERARASDLVLLRLDRESRRE